MIKNIQMFRHQSNSDMSHNPNNPTAQYTPQIGIASNPSLITDATHHVIDNASSEVNSTDINQQYLLLSQTERSNMQNTETKYQYFFLELKKQQLALLQQKQQFIEKYIQQLTQHYENFRELSTKAQSVEILQSLLTNINYTCSVLNTQTIELQSIKKLIESQTKSQEIEAGQISEKLLTLTQETLKIQSLSNPLHPMTNSELPAASHPGIDIPSTPNLHSASSAITQPESDHLALEASIALMAETQGADYFNQAMPLATTAFTTHSSSVYEAVNQENVSSSAQIPKNDIARSAPSNMLQFANFRSVAHSHSLSTLSIELEGTSKPNSELPAASHPGIDIPSTPNLHSASSAITQPESDHLALEASIALMAETQGADYFNQAMPLATTAFTTHSSSVYEAVNQENVSSSAQIPKNDIARSAPSNMLQFANFRSVAHSHSLSTLSIELEGTSHPNSAANWQSETSYLTDTNKIPSLPLSFDPVSPAPSSLSSSSAFVSSAPAAISPAPTLADNSKNKRKPRERGGNSCHQCKIRQDETHLLFCNNKISNSKCQKKYCRDCIKNHYQNYLPLFNINKAPVSQPNRIQIICFACKGTCGCPACFRKKAAHSSSAREAISLISEPTQHTKKRQRKT